LWSVLLFFLFVGSKARGPNLGQVAFRRPAGDEAADSGGMRSLLRTRGEEAPFCGGRSQPPAADTRTRTVGAPGTLNTTTTTTTNNNENNENNTQSEGEEASLCGGRPQPSAADTST